MYVTHKMIDAHSMNFKSLQYVQGARSSCLQDDCNKKNEKWSFAIMERGDWMA